MTFNINMVNSAAIEAVVREPEHFHAVTDDANQVLVEKAVLLISTEVGYSLSVARSSLWLRIIQLIGTVILSTHEVMDAVIQFLVGFPNQ